MGQKECKECANASQCPLQEISRKFIENDKLTYDKKINAIFDLYERNHQCTLLSETDRQMLVKDIEELIKIDTELIMEKVRLIRERNQIIKNNSTQ